MDNKYIDIDSLTRETRRLCQRYIDEIVLPYSLCPWAAPALKAGAVQITVIAEQYSPPQDFARAGNSVRDALSTCTDEAIELVLIVLPCCTFSRIEMDELLRHVRRDGSPPDRRGSELSFALAAFHPQAAPDTSTAERFIPYLRRSPDPMIQAVRGSVLRSIDPSRGAGTSYFDLKRMSLDSLSTPTPEPLRARIARANLEACERAGLDQMEERYLAIMEDRRRTWDGLRDRKV